MLDSSSPIDTGTSEAGTADLSVLDAGPLDLGIDRMADIVLLSVGGAGGGGGSGGVGGNTGLGGAIATGGAAGIDARPIDVSVDHGAALRKLPSTGPDICIDSDPPIWVEAVAIGPGEGADRVQSREERQYEDGTDDPNVWAGDLPSEESLILRRTNALETKLSAFCRYRKAGVMAERDSCIVAISFAAIDDAFYFFSYAEIPIVIKAMFGIGRDMLSYAREGDAPPRWFHPHRPRTTKNSGTAVLANVFSAGHANEISGVFATAWDLANSSDSGEKLMFVNNPRARNVISRGTFPFGSEFIARDGNITRQHWSPFNPLTGGPWPLPAG